MNGSRGSADLESLWAFARGDFEPREFERWFLDQAGLESLLGTDLHWRLTADDYRDRETVWKLREGLRRELPPVAACHCHKARNIDHIPMGGEVDEDGKFWSDHFFAPIEVDVPHSSPEWWRDLRHCTACETKWLVAQEERIFDEWFIARLSEGEFAAARKDDWPERFATYYDVLAVGRNLVTPCSFFDSAAGSLIWTVEDLRREKPEIEKSEIAYLLGISERNVERLMSKAQASQR